MPRYEHLVTRVVDWLRQPFDGQRECVTDATFSLNDAGHAGVGLQLAPEAEDLHVDAAVEHVLVNACRLQKMLAAEGISEEELVADFKRWRTGRRK